MTSPHQVLMMKLKFDDLEQAIGQARVAICELALDFLPIQSCQYDCYRNSRFLKE